MQHGVKLRSIKDISVEDLEQILPEEPECTPVHSPRNRGDSVHEVVHEASDYYNFGNASDIGFRKGEQQVLYERTMDELTGRQQKVNVSIIYMSQHRDFEGSHMKIIKKHQQDSTREMFKDQQESLGTKSCWQRLLAKAKGLFYRPSDLY